MAKTLKPLKSCWTCRQLSEHSTKKRRIASRWLIRRFLNPHDPNADGLSRTFHFIPNGTDSSKLVSNLMMDYSRGVAKTIVKSEFQDPDPDWELVAAVAQGDPRAMDALYQRHAPSLLAYLAARLGERTWAEEVLQEVMLAVWQNAPRFRGHSRVYTWLIAITRNRATNAIQRRKSPPAVPLSPLEKASSSVEVEADDLFQADRLRAAMLCLPDEQREILELVFFHGLSNRETALVLGIPKGTVKSRLSRAKARLRQSLQEDE